MSKSGHFILLNRSLTAASVATIFIREILRLHGCPRSIVSDRDKVFRSFFWDALFLAIGTQLKLSMSYHPQIEGQTKVVNRGIEIYLRCFAMTTPSKWASWLPWAEFSYYTAFYISAQIFPFEAVYGPRVTISPGAFSGD